MNDERGPNREESNDESPNGFPQKEGPYHNHRQRYRHHRVDLEVASNDEENGGDGEMNDESLEEILFDCARHAKRKTVLPEDIQLARCIKFMLVNYEEY